MANKPRKKAVKNIAKSLEEDLDQAANQEWDSFVDNVYDMSKITGSIRKKPFQSPPHIRRGYHSPVSVLEDSHPRCMDDEELWLCKTLHSTSTPLNGQASVQKKDMEKLIKETKEVVSKAMALMDSAMNLGKTVTEIDKNH